MARRREPSCSPTRSHRLPAPPTPPTRRAMSTAFGTTYFSANGGPGFHELWKTDGTAAGTKLVRSVTLAATSTASLAVAGDKVYFRATDVATGDELWVSDGTSGGTQMLRDIRPGFSSSNASFLTAVGEPPVLHRERRGDRTGTLDHQRHTGRHHPGQGHRAGLLELGTERLDPPARVCCCSPPTAASRPVGSCGSATARGRGTQLVSTCSPARSAPARQSSRAPTAWCSSAPTTALAESSCGSPTAPPGAPAASPTSSPASAAATPPASPRSAAPCSSPPPTATRDRAVEVGRHRRRDRARRRPRTGHLRRLADPAHPPRRRHRVLRAHRGERPRALDLGRHRRWHAPHRRPRHRHQRLAAGGLHPGGSRFVFFTAASGGSDRELWRSDGTAAGTVRITSGLLEGTSPSDLTLASGQLLFSAADKLRGREPFVLDLDAANQAVGFACGAGRRPELECTDPVLGAVSRILGRQAPPATPGFLLLGLPSTPLTLAAQPGNTCALFVAAPSCWRR